MSLHPAVQAVIDQHTEALQKQVDELQAENNRLNEIIGSMSICISMDAASEEKIAKIKEWLDGSALSGGLWSIINNGGNVQVLDTDKSLKDILKSIPVGMQIPNELLSGIPKEVHSFKFNEDGSVIHFKPNEAFDSSHLNPSVIDEVALIAPALNHEKELISYEFTNEQNAKLAKNGVDFFKMMMEKPNPAPNDERSVATDLPSALTTPTTKSLDDNPEKQSEPKDIASKNTKKKNQQEKKK